MIGLCMNKTYGNKKYNNRYDDRYDDRDDDINEDENDYENSASVSGPNDPIFDGSQHLILSEDYQVTTATELRPQYTIYPPF